MLLRTSYMIASVGKSCRQPKRLGISIVKELGQPSFHGSDIQ